MYRTDGMVEWVEDAIGPLAETWPESPTVIVAYDLEQREREPFGTEAAPDVPLKHAVAASVAVPFVFEPVQLAGRWYADGGIATGTSADLLLASPETLDLVIVIAPLAASEARPGARFYEDVFDRAGRLALSAELAEIHAQWPETDVLVFRPDDRVLAAARPNPMSVTAAIPAFLRTLRSLKDELSHHETWDVLERHLVLAQLDGPAR
jgi:NTE family protein